MNERELNDNPQDKINPDEVRIEKLEKIVGECGSYHAVNKNKRTLIKSGYSIFECLNEINALSQTEHYNSKEITDALLQFFIHDDIIEFLLTDYLNNL